MSRTVVGSPSRARRRLARVSAGTFAAAIVLTTAGPAVANAAGAGVPNPVAAAVRASSSKVGALLGKSDKPAKSKAAKSEAASSEGRGARVSTVAKCAPHGKDRLFSVLGDDLANKGAFVSAAAKGETLVTPFGSFNLATAAGAASLCEALDAARAALPAGSERAKPGKGKGAENGKAGEKGKSDGKGKSGEKGNSGAARERAESARGQRPTGRPAR